MARILIGWGFLKIKKDRGFTDDFHAESIGDIDHRVQAVERYLERQDRERRRFEDNEEQQTVPIDRYQGLDREQRFASKEYPPYPYDKEHKGAFTDELEAAIEAYTKINDSIPFISINHPIGNNKDDLRQLQVARQIYMDIVDRTVSAAVSLSNRERMLEEKIIGV